MTILRQSPVISDFIKNLRCKINVNPENICCIYPCTPLLTGELLSSLYEKFISSGASYCYPVTPYRHPIQRAIKLVDSIYPEFVYPDQELTRTQDLESSYHDTGTVLLGPSQRMGSV